MGTEEKVYKYLDVLILRYPILESVKDDIRKLYHILERCFQNDGKLILAGNGGSYADAEHIAGELMKSFKKDRRVPEDFGLMLKLIDEEKGKHLENVLERGLSVIVLSSQGSLSSAYINDKCPDALYAQQLLNIARKGDVFFGISTSGNSKNIIYAGITAKALGLRVVGLTGSSESELSDLADVTIRVPETETYIVQELHLPVYHCLCLMLEERFFG